MIATTLTALLVLLGLSIPVGAALGMLGFLLDGMYSMLPLTRAIGEMAWSTSNEFILVAIPLFIMLGEILLRSGLAERMYNAISVWFSWMPGGLMHANIGASTVFSATSGSSVATAATVSTIAIPQIQRNGYNERLFLGSLAAGGTLGILIPPSINLVIYGILSNTSIPALYLAGIVPGLILAAMFMMFIAGTCLVRPAWGGRKVRATWPQRFAALVHLLPPMLIFVLVVGSIYAGIATPTEAAALGVFGALILAACARKISWRMLQEVLEGTMRATTMIVFIIVSAAFLNFIMSATGLTTALTETVLGLDISPQAMLVALVVFYIVLGCFMETLSMMITTIPIIAPIMIALGFDPVWLGILIIVLCEIGLITPPVGMNLFVVQSIRPRGSLNDVMIGSLPYVLVALLLVVLISVFPGLVLWLPGLFN